MNGLNITNNNIKYYNFIIFAQINTVHYEKKVAIYNLSSSE